VRIAFVHYHLHPGGVTRILQSALATLEPHGIEAVILSGEPADEPWPVPVAVVEGLGYEERRAACSPFQLAAQLQSAAREALGAAPDLWHVHNHSLGKNLALPGALRQMAADGQRLLLQIHDFPEDGRPEVYRRQRDRLAQGDTHRLGELLYPHAAQIHYAVLNGRDYAILSAAGAGEYLHALPNPVTMGPAPATSDDTKDRPPLWLYPTRAIRRKNLGEFLLWSALAGPGERFATTQAPRNPLEQPIYRRWTQLAAELGLPVEFEVGARPGTDFDALVRSAHALLTTSVAEGFGMAFLEPWLADRPVCGRDLPEITSEFTQAGVRFHNLYPRLNIPLDWLDLDELRRAAKDGLRRTMGAYGRRVDGDALERTLDAWINDNGIDFGRLDEVLQARIIRHIARNPTDRRALRPNRLERNPETPANIAANRRVIEKQYGLEPYGNRLLAIYEHLLNAPTEPLQSLDGHAILDAFLAPERLFLLRS
jgi:glycosyltransferase involved in cell wall biosynthesis